MPHDATVVSIWLDAIDAFNRGDIAGYGLNFADNAHIMVNAATIATSRNEHIAGFRDLREKGFTAQQPLSVSARSNVLAFHHRNEFADGTANISGGLALFGNDGKIVFGRALNRRPKPLAGDHSNPHELDEATIVANWRGLMAAFNAGDLTTMASFYADTVTHIANDVTIATNRDELIRSASEGRARGFTGRHTESMCSKGNVLTEHFSTTVDDGSRGQGSLIALFGDDGRILATRSLTAGLPPLRPPGR